MTIRTILVPLSGGADDDRVLAAALDVGRTFEAHVDAFHVIPDPRDSVAFVSEGMTSTMIEEVMVAAAAEGEARQTRAREVFERRCQAGAITLSDTPAALGFSAHFGTATGRENDLLAARGRRADLIVAARPAGEEAASSQARLEVVLMETGRPILVVPPDGGAPAGGRVAIAWNGSQEAARSIGWSMPFLAGADGVIVLEVGEGDESTMSGIASYLAWHGIEATTKRVEAGAAAAGARLLQVAGEAGAGTLVMGAYTHSRLRHLILGGVTSHVLEHAEIPLLMTH